MVFASLEFIFLFLPIFLFLYFILPFRAWRNVMLFIFSLIFYAWGEPVYVIFLFISMMINYSLSRIIDSLEGKKRRAVLFIGVFYNILILIIFKYMDFLISNINAVFGTEIGLLNISLPIGISFFAFQILSYLADVYCKKVEVQKNPLYLGAYIFAFPQLIAGPIVRYQTIEDEMKNRKETIEGFSLGARRFMVGMAKKVLIANNVAFIADTIFEHSVNSYGMMGAWIAVISYTLQIYYDFSSYSDMAIGLGQMLGFHYEENFNYPYISTSIKDFWKRWHISLSSFFRDYVYIPLGGGRSHAIRNTLIVWLLTGLWHGASWNYVLWGLYYAVLLFIERALSKRFEIKVPSLIKHLYAIIFIMIGWVIFRTENVSQIPEILKAMIGFYGSGSLNFMVYTQILKVRYVAAFIIGIIFSMPILSKINVNFGSKAEVRAVLDTGFIFVFLISIMYVVMGSYNPFIYFKF